MVEWGRSEQIPHCVVTANLCCQFMSKQYLCSSHTQYLNLFAKGGGGGGGGLLSCLTINIRFIEVNLKRNFNVYGAVVSIMFMTTL